MSSTTQKLIEKGLAVGAPPFLKTNVQYEVITGSHAYGVADTSVKDKMPDFDVYGWAIPPKNLIFPHLAGHIPNFGPSPPCFEQWQNHHMIDQDALGGLGKEWDLQIFNIVKFFELCRQNNPNMIDSLYVPENCVIHCTQIGRMVRDHRRLFLSKEAWKKFRGYSHGQLKQMDSGENYNNAETLRRFEDKNGIPTDTKLSEVMHEVGCRGEELVGHSVTDEKSTGKLNHLDTGTLLEYQKQYLLHSNKSSRFEMVKIHGYDIKFAYHIIRLLDEAEQIILEGDLNLQRAKEAMKSVRRGDWKAEDIHRWAMEKEIALEKAYTNCKLPEHAPVEPLRQLLYNCLEAHYGSLSDCVTQVNWAEQSLKEIDSVLDKVRKSLYN